MNALLFPLTAKERGSVPIDDQKQDWKQQIIADKHFDSNKFGNGSSISHFNNTLKSK